jgi:autotransporter-associated beta strand protein
VVPGGTPGEFPHNLPVGTRQTFTVKRTAAGVTPARVWLEVLNEPATLTWSGATSTIWDTTTGTNWGGASPSTFGSNDAVIFNDTSTNLSAVSLSGSVDPRTVLVNNTSRAYTFSGTGALTGGGSLTKMGSGLLTISNSGTSTFSGGTFINGGSIVLADTIANASGLGTGPITFNGGTLTMAGFNGSTSAEFAPLPNALIVPAGQTGTIQLTQRAPKPTAASIFPAIYGGLSGGGTLNLTIKFVRADVLGDWSDFTGVLNIVSADSDGGDFRFGTSGSWPGLPAATVNLGAKMAAYYVGTSASGAGTTIEIGELSGTSSSYLAGGATGARNFAYRIGGKTLVGSEVVFAGSIGEQGADTSGNVPTSSMIKTGAGTWTLSGVCNWNGGTTVEQGTLKISGSVKCGAATSVATLATLNLANGSLTTDALDIASGATLSLSGNAKLTGDLNNDGTVTATAGGSFTVAGDVVNDGTLRIANGTALSATGDFVNNGVLDLLTATGGLPPNLVNNGIVIDSSTLRTVAAAKNGNTVTVTVQGHSGHTYQLQRADSLISPNWTNVSGSVGNGTTQANGQPTPIQLQDPNAGTQRFYRVQVTP